MAFTRFWGTMFFLDQVLIPIHPVGHPVVLREDQISASHQIAQM